MPRRSRPAPLGRRCEERHSDGSWGRWVAPEMPLLAHHDVLWVMVLTMPMLVTMPVPCACSQGCPQVLPGAHLHARYGANPQTHPRARRYASACPPAYSHSCPQAHPCGQAHLQACPQVFMVPLPLPMLVSIPKSITVRVPTRMAISMPNPMPTQGLSLTRRTWRCAGRSPRRPAAGCSGCRRGQGQRICWDRPRSCHLRCRAGPRPHLGTKEQPVRRPTSYHHGDRCDTPPPHPCGHSKGVLQPSMPHDAL